MAGWWRLCLSSEGLEDSQAVKRRGGSVTSPPCLSRVLGSKAGSERCPQAPCSQGLGEEGPELGSAAAPCNHAELGLVGAHLKCWRGKEAETSFWTGDSPGIERQSHESSAWSSELGLNGNRRLAGGSVKGEEKVPWAEPCETPGNQQNWRWDTRTIFMSSKDGGFREHLIISF